MVYIDLLYKKDLHRPVVEDIISTPIVYGEVQAHRFWVQAAETLAGSVTGRFVRPDGSSVLLASSGGYAGITDGKAWVVLSKECYAYSGYARLYINITNGAQVTTILNMRLTVGDAIDGITVDPGNAMNLDAGKLEIVVSQADKVQRFSEIADKFINRNPTTQDYLTLAAKLPTEPHRNVNGTRGLEAYPTDVGNYRVTSVRFAGLPPDCSLYGELHISGSGYYTHIYRGLRDDIYVGHSEDNVQAPQTWSRVMYESPKTVLQKKTVTTTTSSNGNINLGLYRNAAVIVGVDIKSINNDATKNAFAIVGRYNSDLHGAKVINEISGTGVNVLADTNVALDVYYYEL